MRSVGNFGYVIDETTPATIELIWDAGQATQEITDSIDPRQHYTVSVFLESLRLDVYIPSFDKAPFPAIYPEDTVAERSTKLMEVEQKAPKTGLAFYRKRPNDRDWHYLSEIVLQNRGRRTQIPIIVPYFTTNQLKMLSWDTLLGVEVLDYGSGAIGGGPIIGNRPFDQVHIEGDFRIDIDPSEFKRNRVVNYQREINVSSMESLLIPYNPNRAFFEIQNNGDRDLLVNFTGNQNVIQPYIIRAGQTYYPNTESVITDDIYGRTSFGSITVVAVETEFI